MKCQRIKKRHNKAGGRRLFEIISRRNISGRRRIEAKSRAKGR
jgi:hypothetical protein